MYTQSLAWTSGVGRNCNVKTNVGKSVDQSYVCVRKKKKKEKEKRERENGSHTSSASKNVPQSNKRTPDERKEKPISTIFEC